VSVTYLVGVTLMPKIAKLVVSEVSTVNKTEAVPGYPLVLYRTLGLRDF